MVLQQPIQRGAPLIRKCEVVAGTADKALLKQGGHDTGVGPVGVGLDVEKHARSAAVRLSGFTGSGAVRVVWSAMGVLFIKPPPTTFCMQLVCQTGQ